MNHFVQHRLWFQMWVRVCCMLRNVQWPVCWFQPCSILGSEVSLVLDNVPIVTDGSICIHQWGDLAVRHGCNTMMLFTVNKKAMQKLCSKQGFTVLSIRRASDNRLHLWDTSVCHYNWIQPYLFLSLFKPIFRIGTHWKHFSLFYTILL